MYKVSALRNQREGLFQPCVFTIPCGHGRVQGVPLWRIPHR
nr:MAG TPA: hypothetical protein [Caudoviricetes sp.]